MRKITKNKNLPSNEELEILQYIKDYIQEHQYAPSNRDIMHHFGFSSSSFVAARLSHMKKLGLINYVQNQPRTLSIEGYYLHFFPGKSLNPAKTM